MENSCSLRKKVAMSNWFPTHGHTTFSLLDGLSKPEQIAKRLVECGYAGAACTDHGNLGACPSFVKALTKHNLKPILGCEFYVCQQDSTIQTKENASLSHLVVLAKNLQGWKNLMKASSTSFRPENSYRKPRLDIEKLGKIGAGEFICFSGHMGSDLANVCFDEPKLAYNCASYEEARTLVSKNWESRVNEAVLRYQKAFGRENFYLEIQLVDQTNLPAVLVVARILRHCGKKLGVPCVATADSHYPRREDAADQRILLCTSLDTTLKEVQRKLDANEDVGLGAFFKSNNYHIPSLREMEELHAGYPEELENSLKIADRCEVYAVGGKPKLPVFACPGGETPDSYLEKLCQEGWKTKIAGRLEQEKQPTYQARLTETELPVLRDAGLSSYFLIKWDVIKYCREVLRAKVGKGRGSAAGCLVSYLLDITRVDPIRYGLSFARFYNAGRNSPGRTALPDIDTDLPIGMRAPAIEYIRAKYGRDKVCQMATFSRMQGRGALKDVLRAHDRCSFEEMGRITEHIPDEAEIADQLQEMREETGEASIIQWALQNNGDALKEWVTLREDGELDGPLALDFAQAIRLEGTKRSMGKHASGLIICSEPLEDIAPMVWDKSSGELMVGVDMNDCEALGLVKFDFLGLRTLDCIQNAESIIRTGRA
jgi:DNA polymerase-3 subunit alpha